MTVILELDDPDSDDVDAEAEVEAEVEAEADALVLLLPAEDAVKEMQALNPHTVKTAASVKAKTLRAKVMAALLT